VYGLRRDLAGRQQSLARYERQIADLGDVAKMLETTAKRQGEIDASLAEVSQLGATHAAWSPILVALTQVTPKEIVISEILAKREEAKGAPEQQKAPPSFSLVMGVTSPLGAGAVEQLIAALRKALPLKPGLDSIQILSQRHLESEGQMVQYYIIECKLRP
jgi:hypothetical protein